MEYLLERWIKDEEVRVKAIVKKRRISCFLISLFSAFLICGCILLIEWMNTMNLIESIEESAYIFSGCFLLCILSVFIRKDTVSARIRHLKTILEKDFKDSEQLECLIREMERIPLFEMEDPCTKEIFVLTPHYMMKTGSRYMITKADDIATIKYLKVRGSQSQHMKYMIECRNSEGKVIGDYQFSLPDTFEAVCRAVSRFRGEELIS